MPVAQNTSESAVSAPLVGEDLAGVLRDCMVATQRLQSTHERLQDEVLRLRRELASKNRELERGRRLASLGELAAGVAHEVRNPLGAIRLYAQLLRDRWISSEEARDLLDKIELGVRAIDGVVADTLSLTPRAGRMGEFQVGELIEQAREYSRPALERCGVDLKVESACDGLRVRGERAALQRVLVNLLNNAAEASPAGGTVELLAQTGAGRVRLEVADRGCGLSDELLDRIFDPFFTTKEHGTGLGLPIAHRLVELHGGRLSARQRRGGGAVFEVELPIGEDTEDAAAASQPDAA